MLVNMPDFKQSITKLPVYLDGKFKLFDIKQTAGHLPREYLSDTSKEMYYEELSLTDRLKFKANQRKIDLTLKIRIPQTREISSLNVLKIGDKYHKVFNAYHFINQDGFPQTDLTLENYPNVLLEENLPVTEEE
jgi:hypothetical protein